MKTGVQVYRNYLNILDSGFRRNDEKRGIVTFYETIFVDCRSKRKRFWILLLLIMFCQASVYAQSKGQPSKPLSASKTGDHGKSIAKPAQSQNSGKSVSRQDKLSNELNVSCRITEEIQTGTPYHKGCLEWNVNLELTNISRENLSFGDDLIIMEAGPQDDYDGVYVVYHNAAPEKKPGNWDYYDRAHAYAIANFDRNWPDGTYRGYQNGGTYSLADPPEYKPKKTFCNSLLTPGSKVQYQTSLKQGVWFRREHCSTVFLVLPEIRNSSSSLSIRVILVLNRSETAKNQWDLKMKSAVLLEKSNLGELLAGSQMNSAMRILALNWLAGLNKEAAAPFILRNIKQKTGLDLVASLQLLANYKISPDAEALDAIKAIAADEKSKNWSQMVAVRYLKETR